MALELRPNCEYCDKDLPPASTEARICTYECTFCAGCVEANWVGSASVSDANPTQFATLPAPWARARPKAHPSRRRSWRPPPPPRIAAGYGIRFAPFVRIRTVPELSGCALPGA
jgi:hypothetical protein